MRQVVNGAKGGPLLGQSSCMSVKSMEMDDEDLDESTVTISGGPRQHVERERRLRREIANSNERRRMQSINHGYNMLKNMLPIKDGSEKLSKAAVLQQAAEHMSQIIEDRKQLLSQNAELTRALSCKRSRSSSISSGISSAGTNGTIAALAVKRQKRDTESSDEGISLTYQPVISNSYLAPVTASADPEQQHVIDELRRDVTELRVQLEREKQRRVLLEQSYSSYYNSFVQAAQQSVAAINGGRMTTSPTSLQPPLMSPPQSRHSSIDDEPQQQCDRLMHNEDYRQPDSSNSISSTNILSSSSADVCDEVERRAPIPTPTSSYGKASSVASQNLSIIVEAINHLESDKERMSITSSDRDADSGVSHCDYSDDTKSDCSRTETPQPPPAHQTNNSSIPAYHHHPHHHASLLSTASAPGPHGGAPSSALPLIYRPTFLSRTPSGLATVSSQTAQASPVGVIVSHHSS